VTEEWPAVAAAINQRMTELGLTQSDLCQRSQVSKAAVGELRHNTVQRHRSPRTLEALSVALSWHPEHLAAVASGHKPPRAAEPAPVLDHNVSDRLAAIEWHLRQILDRLNAMDPTSSAPKYDKITLRGARGSNPEPTD
jgi:transcriptional regulator with XRE-family HTH domain